MALTKLREVDPPIGWVLAMYRAPIFLYRIGLGGLLGKRFLLLFHIGRKSGMVRRTVLEVVRHGQNGTEFVVASGFGEHSQWYQNLMHRSDATIQIGWRKFEVTACRIPPADAEAEMVSYGHRSPRAAKMVAGLIGYEHQGSADDLRALSRIVPLIRLTTIMPHEPSDPNL